MHVRYAGLLQVPHCILYKRQSLQALIVQKGPPTRLYVIRNAPPELPLPLPLPQCVRVFLLVACTKG